MASYLIVANQTIGSPKLTEVLQAAAAHGPCRFHLVVPATRIHDQMVYTDGSSRAVARDRLAKGLAHLAELGLQASGEVGDPNPMVAIEDALIAQSFDAVVLSTLPGTMSRWARQRLPDKVRRKTHLPVVHVESLSDNLTWPLISDRPSTVRAGDAAVQRSGFDLVRDALNEASLTLVNRGHRSIVRERVDALHRTLDWHLRAINAPDGLLSEIRDDAPQLTFVSKRLARHADELASRAAALAAALEIRSAEHSPMAELSDGERMELANIVVAVERHLHDGTQLVFDAFQVDVSAQ